MATPRDIGSLQMLVDRELRPKPKVLLAVPNLGWVRRELVVQLLRLTADPRYRVTLTLPVKKPIEANHAAIAAQAIGDGFDWLLSIDADNPPIMNPLDLIKYDLDLVGCPTPIFYWTGDKPGERAWYWNAYRFHAGSQGYREWQPQRGLQEVDAIGSGCFLVRVAALATCITEHPGGHMARRFDRFGHVVRGGDIAFSERMRACGFKVWAHFDYPCQHFAEVALGDIIESSSALVRGLLKDNPDGG